MQTCPLEAVAGLASASGSSAHQRVERRDEVPTRPANARSGIRYEGASWAHVTMSTIYPTLTEAAATEVFAGMDWGGVVPPDLPDRRGRQVLLPAAVPTMSPGSTNSTGRSTCHPGAGCGSRSSGPRDCWLSTCTSSAVEIFCVSPKISARARERYRLAASKSDTFDAFVLADTLRHEHRHWRALTPPSPLTAELRAISRDRHRMLHAKQATENRLRAVLEAYHPAPLHLFSKLDRDITLDFITDYPTPEQAGRVGDRADGRVLPPARLLRAAPSPRYWSSGYDRICCPPARAQWPARRSPRAVHRAAADAQHSPARLRQAPLPAPRTRTPIRRSSSASPGSDPSWPPR